MSIHSIKVVSKSLKEEIRSEAFYSSAFDINTHNSKMQSKTPFPLDRHSFNKTVKGVVFR